MKIRLLVLLLFFSLGVDAEIHGVKGGLVVCVGSDALESVSNDWKNGAFIFQCLETSDAEVSNLRKKIKAAGCSGRVSVSQWDGKSLPYVNNLVNLIVVAGGTGRVASEELTRVLAPRGVVVSLATGHSPLASSCKPWPDNIDEWTHWMHDASGNGVAKDTVVGPPRHFQWLARPYWSKHHDSVLSLSAMVSAHGRIFYICNEMETSCVFSEKFQGKWSLIARDAFNGVLLWKRPVKDWGWKTWGDYFNNRFSQPVQLASRLVADGDTVYATLGFHQPVVAMDAATGKTIREYESDYVDEILVHDGSLIVSSYTAEELEAFMATKPKPAMKKTGYKKSAAKEGPTILKSVRRYDAKTGKMVWRRDGFAGLPVRYDSSQGYDRVYLTADDDRVVFLTRKKVHCLELATGKTRWEVPRPEFETNIFNLGYRMSENAVVVNHGGVVLVGQPVGKRFDGFHTVPCTVQALDAKTGKELWSRQAGIWGWGSAPDIFAINGLVWMHNHALGEKKDGRLVWDYQSAKGKSPPADVQRSLDYALLGVDLHTGEVKKKFSTQDINIMAHHHRCYRNKATEKYILSARRGTELVDLTTGENWIQHWIRSECRYGQMPANGLLYSAPHPCGCYTSVLLKGYNALAARNSRPANMDKPVSDNSRLVKGPAFGSPVGHVGKGWLTYRADIGRSGHADTEVAQKMSKKWVAKLGGDLTGITAANGRCFVASKETHTVHALDAASGKPLWKHVASAQIDTPPTINGNHVLFGSSDGWVYCLAAADGQLVWKYLAAPRDMRLVSDSRPESVWPVHGSVLARDGEVCFMAGRSSYVDGGLWAYRLDAASGRLLEKKNIYSNDPKTDKQVDFKDAFRIAGMQSYVLAGDGASVFNLHEPLFGDGKSQKPIVTAAAGFLDDSLFIRTPWGISNNKKLVAAMLVHDGTFVYGFRPYATTSRTKYHVAEEGYDIFCAPIKPTENPAVKRKEKTRKNRKANRIKSAGKDRWKSTQDVLVKGMASARNALLVAGVPDVVDPADPYAAFDGRMGGKLLLMSKEDGSVQQTMVLDHAPAWDGLAVEGGRLFIASADGTLLCFE